MESRLKKAKRVKLIFLILLMVIGLTGCSNETTYTNVNTDIAIENLRNQTVGTSDWLTSEKYLNWCQKMKWYSIPIIVVSVLFGIFLLAVFKGVKQLQKVGLFVFIIGIPSIVLILVYFACYMYGKLF